MSRRRLLRVETTALVTESVGATPILVHEGRRWVADDGSGFVAGRPPRTVVGWNGAETLLVTVDGRRPGYSIGLSLPDTAELLRIRRRHTARPDPGLIAVAAGMEVAMAQWLLIVVVGRRRRRSAV